jgi:hypothetical protein
VTCWIHIISLMLYWAHPDYRNVARLNELSRIASATCEACNDDTHESVTLTSIASYESGFRIHALGRLGEIGPWQLRYLSSKTSLNRQAREALHRVHLSLSYCGDLRWYASGTCTMGSEASAKRMARAKEWEELEL